MHIRCPFCGERDLSEFVYHGDAGSGRPDPAAAQSAALFFEAVYLRDNPLGLHDELWYHAFGCRGFLRVTRDTRSHEIVAVGMSMQVRRS